MPEGARGGGGSLRRQNRPGPLPPESERVTARHRRYAEVSAEHLPRTIAAAATLAGHISTDQYLWGLHRVLDGVTLRATAGRAGAPTPTPEDF